MQYEVDTREYHKEPRHVPCQKQPGVWGEKLKSLQEYINGAVAQPGRAAEHLLAVKGYKASTLQTRRAGVQIPPAPPLLLLYYVLTQFSGGVGWFYAAGWYYYWL